MGKNLVEEYRTEKIPYGYAGSPVITGDTIILNVNTAGVALNKTSGEKMWASPVHTGRINSQGYHATPVLHEREGKRCALLFSGTGLFAVEVGTGKQLWFHERYNTSYANVADPIHFENKVIFSNREGCELLAMTEVEPDVVWRNEKVISGVTNSVLIDGYLYGCYGTPDWGRGALRCLDTGTGDVLWEKDFKIFSFSAAGGKLIILEEDGTLRVAEDTPSSNRELTSANIRPRDQKFAKFWAPPVFIQILLIRLAANDPLFQYQFQVLLLCHKADVFRHIPFYDQDITAFAILQDTRFIVDSQTLC